MGHSPEKSPYLLYTYKDEHIRLPFLRLVPPIPISVNPAFIYPRGAAVLITSDGRYLYVDNYTIAYIRR
jgi:6-phosphogluconolactonase (cycloisomerase 2 family)